MAELSRKSVKTMRLIVQWSFLFWVIVIGIRFGLFINSLESGATPLVSRPPGVEGFLPIGALVSLKYWLISGSIHPVHPAAPIIFLSILLMSLLAKKSFCSWLCPVGTLSEGAHRLGITWFHRNFRIWRWLDFFLRGSKYLLLLVFAKLVLIDMPAEALGGFLDAPYWAASDIKMLHFFTRISVTTLVVLATLTLLSLFFENFWCRYLCPYGALLGLVSLVSPFKIRRDPAACTGCKRCSAACPAGIAVHRLTTVSSPECNGCLTCTANCPEKRALAMQPVFWKRPLAIWIYPAAVVLIFLAGIGTGMATGHWSSSLSSADYERLISLEPSLSH